MLQQAIQNTHIETIKLAVGLLILIVVNIVMGSVNSIFTAEFDYKILFRGIIKAIILTLCYIGVYAAGIINENILSIDLGGNDPINIIDAMHAILLAGYFSYSKQIILKMQALINGGKEDDDRSEPPSKSENQLVFPDEGEGDYYNT